MGWAEKTFRGEAEHQTVSRIKAAVGLPVIANGDIDSPARARQVLDQSGADGLMIGRAAQGNPWIFREIAHFLESGELLPPPAADEVRDTLLEHLDALYSFYGEYRGVRVARKHLGWYLKPRPGGAALWTRINRVESTAEQQRMVREFFQQAGGTAPEKALELAA